jgi:hypothetical protein
MGTIETKYDLSRDLTLVKATGTMTADDHRARIKKFNDDTTVTSLILWDVTGAYRRRPNTLTLLQPTP